MRYSIKPRDRIYVKVYGFLFFAKNMNNKSIQKILDSAKNSTADAIKIASKTVIQKTAEAIGGLIGNKIADKITSISKSPNKLHSVELHSKTNENEMEITKERYISLVKRGQITDELRLI